MIMLTSDIEYSDMEVKIEYATNPVLRQRIELARITEEIGTLRY